MEYYKVFHDYNDIYNISKHTSKGISIFELINALEQFGFKADAYCLPFEKLITIPTPQILYFKQNHYVVVTSINMESITISDPASGLINYDAVNFKNKWLDFRNNKGIVILISNPTNCNFRV